MKAGKRWNSSLPSSIDNSFSWVNLGYNDAETGIFGSIATPDKKTVRMGMSIRCIKD